MTLSVVRLYRHLLNPYHFNPSPQHLVKRGPELRRTARAVMAADAEIIQVVGAL
jgi:hypothetical protein